MPYSIRQAYPVSWFIGPDGSQGDAETLAERPDAEICEELPEGERVEIAIQGHGTYAIRQIEERSSGEIYVEWWSIEEIEDQEPE